LRRLQLIKEAEVIAEFLKSEFHHDEFHHYHKRFEHIVFRAVVSNAALLFNAGAPFLFQGGLSRPQYSGYLEDSFRIGSNVTVSAGSRYDRSSLVVEAWQLSPRLGVAYSIKRTGTTLRASFNRLFMTPQIENLLLSSSPQARALSPFADQNGGGAAVAPERTSAYEVGVVQRMKGLTGQKNSWVSSGSGSLPSE
jgi:outer membrane receptor protein involved in Fe transport